MINRCVRIVLYLPKPMIDKLFVIANKEDKTIDVLIAEKLQPCIIETPDGPEKEYFGHDTSLE